MPVKHAKTKQERLDRADARIVRLQNDLSDATEQGNNENISTLAARLVKVTARKAEIEAEA